MRVVSEIIRAPESRSPGQGFNSSKIYHYYLVHKITVKLSFDEDGFRLEICLINFIQITKELRMEF